MPSLFFKTKSPAVLIFFMILLVVSGSFHGAGPNHVHRRNVATYSEPPSSEELDILARRDGSDSGVSSGILSLDSNADSDSVSNSYSSFDNAALGARFNINMKRETKTITSIYTTTLNPFPTASYYHSRAYDAPGTQWIDYATNHQPENVVLPKSLLVNGTYQGGIFDYDTYYVGSGVIPLTSTTSKYLKSLTTVPSMNRDGGLGGMIGNTSIFYFCDTTTYTTITKTTKGVFTGMTANSVAVDITRNALNREAIALVDPVGMYYKDNGFQRGWIPNTDAEAAFNKANLPNGRRYALWPLGGLVPYNADSALIFPDITYVDVTSKYGVYQWAGNTVVQITIENGQPTAKRLVPRLHVGGQPPYGSMGGYRSWGYSGEGGNDGKVYLFGPGKHGMYITRTNAATVSDISTYEYWHADPCSVGGVWNTNPVDIDTDAFISNPFNVGYSSGSIIYSPRHGTFIFIFMTNSAWNTLYYSILLSPTALHPQYGTSRYNDVAEALTKYKWSSPKTLLLTPAPWMFTYDGGVHIGYFGADDIVNGGTKMLVSWTAPQKAGGDVYGGGYNTMTAEVDWN